MAARLALVAIAAGGACSAPPSSSPHPAWSAGSGSGDGPPGASEPPPGAGQADPTPPAPDPEPAPDPQPAPSDEPDGALAGIVAAHNAVRARHCAPPLVWSEKIAKVARGWAAELRDRGCAFEHSAGMKYGENLAYMAPAGIGSPESVVDGWYREVDAYDFRSGRFGFDTGHFTQVVWESTAELGCARVECQNAEIWVCNYYPPGNFQGQFSANVHPESCRKRSR